jgi:hypothetical protein
LGGGEGGKGGGGGGGWGCQAQSSGLSQQVLPEVVNVCYQV